MSPSGLNIHQLSINKSQLNREGSPLSKNNDTINEEDHQNEGSSSNKLLTTGKKAKHLNRKAIARTTMTKYLKDNTTKLTSKSP